MKDKDQEDKPRQRAQRPRAMEEQDRAATFALAELWARFAFFALSADGKDRISAEAVNQYSEFLLKAEVFSQEEMSALWRHNSDAILLLRGAREACVEMTAALMGMQVRYVFLEVLSRTEGVHLEPAAASRCLLLLDRMEKFKAPYTDEEIAKLRATPYQEAFVDGERLVATLEKAAAGGGKREDCWTLAGFGRALTQGLAFSLARDGISFPIFARYAAAVSEAGFRGHRELAKLWNEEEGVAKPMREACRQTGINAAASLSHYLGLLVIDILGRIDSVALTDAGAEQALTMIERVREGEEVVTEAERQQLDEMFAAEFKGGADLLKHELQRIAAVETVH